MDMYELYNEQLTMFLLRASIHSSISRVLATVQWTGGGDAIFSRIEPFHLPSRFFHLRLAYRTFFHRNSPVGVRELAESGVSGSRPRPRPMGGSDESRGRDWQWWRWNVAEKDEESRATPAAGRAAVTSHRDHAHRLWSRMKWVGRRMGMVGNEGRGNRRRNNKQETGCTFRVEYGRVRRGTGKVVSWCKRGDQCMFLRLRRRRDKMGRTRGMFLRLINGKVEMLRARFKLAYIYTYMYICTYICACIRGLFACYMWCFKRFFSFSFVAILFVKSWLFGKQVNEKDRFLFKYINIVLTSI